MAHCRAGVDEAREDGAAAPQERLGEDTREAPGARREEPPAQKCQVAEAADRAVSSGSANLDAQQARATLLATPSTPRAPCDIHPEAITAPEGSRMYMLLSPVSGAGLCHEHADSGCSAISMQTAAAPQVRTISTWHDRHLPAL